MNGLKLFRVNTNIGVCMLQPVAFTAQIIAAFFFLSQSPDIILPTCSLSSGGKNFEKNLNCYNASCIANSKVSCITFILS